MGTLNIGVIGAGRIGSIHAGNVATRIPGARLLSLCDVRVDAAEAIARPLGVERVHRDPAALLGDPDLDAVLICSSTDTHAPLVEAAAAAGKAIFCEKPIDRDLATIDRALAAVKAAGVPLQVGFNRRFDPSFRQVRERVMAGDVGSLELFRITSRDPAPPPLDYVRVSGGLFFDMTIHDFDMARYLTGREVVRVFAQGGVHVDPAIGEAGDIDTAVVVLELEGGLLGTIDNSRRAAYGYDQRIEVFGSAGMLQAGNHTPHQALLSDGAGVHGARPLHFFLDRYAESFLREVREFVDAVVRGTPVPVTGLDGRAPVVIAAAATRSLALGRAVALDEVSQDG